MMYGLRPTAWVPVQVRTLVKEDRRNVVLFLCEEMEKKWEEEEAHLEKRVEDPDQLTARSHPLINKLTSSV